MRKRGNPNKPFSEVETYLLFREYPLITPASADEIYNLLVNNSLNFEQIIQFLVETSPYNFLTEEVQEVYERLIRGQLDSDEPDESKVDSHEGYLENTSKTYRYSFLDEDGLKERKKP